MATLEIRKETSKVWRHVPSDNLPYIVSKLYIKSDGNNIRVVEIGGSQRGIYNFADVSVYDIGGVAETFTSASELMQRLEALGYVGFFYDGEVSPSLLISSDVGNAITLGSDGKLYVSDSGDVEWGEIVGALSNQTDLQNALDLKANTSDLGAVAFSNDYNDLDNLPTIPNNLEELYNVTETNYTNPIDTDSVLTFDVTNSLWKRLSWANIKSNLKSYFDIFYLSLSIFNDFVTDVFSSLDDKLDKNTTPSRVYGTDASGGQTMIPLGDFGTVKGTGTTNRISKFTASGTIGDSQIFDNGTNIGIGTITPNPSSILDLTSTTKGFLPPRMTTAKRNAIVSPIAGLIVYDITENKHFGFDGTSWKSLMDLQEVKKTVELMDSLNVDFYAGYNLKINTITAIVGTPTTIIVKKNDSTYTLGNLISQGDKITVEVDVPSVINLEGNYE